MGLVIAYFIAGVLGAVGLFNFMKNKAHNDPSFKATLNSSPELALTLHLLMVLFWPMAVFAGLVWTLGVVYEWVSEAFKKSLVD